MTKLRRANKTAHEARRTAHLSNGPRLSQRALRSYAGQRADAMGAFVGLIATDTGVLAPHAPDRRPYFW